MNTVMQHMMNLEMIALLVVRTTQQRNLPLLLCNHPGLSLDCHASRVTSTQVL